MNQLKTATMDETGLLGVTDEGHVVGDVRQVTPLSIVPNAPDAARDHVAQTTFSFFALNVHDDEQPPRLPCKASEPIACLLAFILHLCTVYFYSSKLYAALDV